MRSAIDSLCGTNLLCVIGSVFIVSALLCGFVLVIFSNFLLLARYFEQRNARKQDKSGVQEASSIRLQGAILLQSIGIAVISARSALTAGVQSGMQAATPTNAFRLLYVSGALAASILWHEYHSELLMLVDLLWTGVRIVLLNAVSIAVLVLRLVVSSIIPIWNFAWRLAIQLVVGSVLIILKCNVRDVVTALQYFFGFFIEFFTAALNWVADDPTNGPIDLTKAIRNLYDLWLMPRSVLECVCERLEFIWEAIFVDTPFLAPTLNALINIPLTAFTALAGAIARFFTDALGSSASRRTGVPTLGAVQGTGIFDATFKAEMEFVENLAAMLDNVFGHFASVGLTILDKKVNLATAPAMGLFQAFGRIGIGFVLLQKASFNGVGRLMPGSECYNKEIYPNYTDTYACVREGLCLKGTFTEMDRAAYFVGANVNWAATVTFRLLYHDVGVTNNSLSAFDEPVIFQCGDFTHRACWEGYHGMCDVGTSYCQYPDATATYGECNTCKDFEFVRDCERLPTEYGVRSCKSSCFHECGCEAEHHSFCKFESLEDVSIPEPGTCNMCPAHYEVECHLRGLNDYGRDSCIGQCFHSCSCDAAAVSYCKGDGTCGECREFYDKRESSCASNKLLSVYGLENCERQCFAPCSCTDSEFCGFEYGNVGNCSACAIDAGDAHVKCYAKERNHEPLKGAAIYDCDSTCQKPCGCERFGRTDGRFCRTNMTTAFTRICSSSALAGQVCVVEDEKLTFRAAVLSSNYSLCDSCSVIEQNRQLCEDFGGGTEDGVEACQDRCFRDELPLFADQVGAPLLSSPRRAELPWGNSLLELLARAGGCAYTSTLRLWQNSLLVQYSLASELVLNWMLPSFHGEYVKRNHPVKIVQRHEGEWYPFGANVSCEYRDIQESLSRAPPSPIDYGYEDFDGSLGFAKPWEEPQGVYEEAFEASWEEPLQDVWDTATDALQHGNAGGRQLLSSGCDGVCWTNEPQASASRRRNPTLSEYCHYYFLGCKPKNKCMIGQNWAERTGLCADDCCTPCPAGKYQGDEVHQKTCISCSAGTYSSPPGPLQGAPGCFSCSSGTFSIVPGSSACSRCPGGYYQPSVETTYCLACPAGLSAAVTGARFLSQCTTIPHCQKGQYHFVGPTLSDGGCDACAQGGGAANGHNPNNAPEFYGDKNNYQDESTTGVSQFCKACPYSWFTETIGLTDPAMASYIDDVQDRLGPYVQVGTVSQECTNRRACCDGAMCPGNYFHGFPQPSAADLESVEKRPFFTKAEVFQLVRRDYAYCVACPTGQYQDETIDVFTDSRWRASPKICKTCPDGKTMIGQPGNMCVSCPNGFWSTIGMSKCESCAGVVKDKILTPQTDYGRTKCTFCDVGFRKYDYYCRKCHAGRYSTWFNLEICAACEPHSYQAEWGKSSCIECGYTRANESLTFGGGCEPEAQLDTGSSNMDLAACRAHCAAAANCTHYAHFDIYCRIYASCNTPGPHEGYINYLMKDKLPRYVDTAGAACLDMQTGFIFANLTIMTQEHAGTDSNGDDVWEATAMKDLRISPCPARTYQDLTDQSICKNCPVGYLGLGSTQSSCNPKTFAPTPAPTNATSLAPTAPGGTYPPTPEPTPVPVSRNAWWSKRDNMQAWITVETVFKVVRTHVFYYDQDRWDTLFAAATGSNGCEHPSDPFFNATSNKIESPCENSMAYLYEGTNDQSWVTPSGGKSFRLIVQCLTWDVDRFTTFGISVAGAIEYAIAHPLETGGLGTSPGRRLNAGFIPGTNAAANGCSPEFPCGLTSNYFTGCTWRKHGILVTQDASVQRDFEPFPDSSIWPLHNRGACVVSKETDMYLDDFVELNNHTAVQCPEQCSTGCDELGYSAFQWTWDSHSRVSSSRCICLSWKQYAFSFNDFVKKATFDSASCGIWAKASLENKFSNDVAMVDEVYKSTATDCAKYCNLFMTDGLVFEPRPYSKFVSETPVCSCVNLTAPATWDSIDRSIFSDCSEVWKKLGNVTTTANSQRCNASSDLYEPFMEDTVNLNSHILPQLEVLGQLAVNTIPSKKIGAFLTPAIRIVDLASESIRAVARVVSTSIEAVYEPEKFYDSNMRGDHGQVWVGEGAIYVACTFEEWLDGFKTVEGVVMNCTCVGAYPISSMTEDFKDDTFGGENVNVSILYSAEVGAKFCNSLMFERVFRAQLEVAYSLQNVASEVGGIFTALLDKQRHTCNASDLMDVSTRKFKTATGWINDYHRPLISGVESPTDNDETTFGLSPLERCTSAMNRNLWCASGVSIKYAANAVVGTFRQLFETVIKTVRLEIPMTEFTNRLCDAQRFVHSAASAIVDIVPLELFLPDHDPTEFDTLRTGFGNVMFAVMQTPIEGAKVINLGFYSIQAILKGEAIADILFQDIYVVAQVFVETIANLLDGIADFMNAVVPGAGDFFATLAKSVKIIGAVVGKTVIQMVALITKVVFEFFGLFTGSVSFGEFITDILLIVEKLWTTLIEGILYLALKIFGLDTDLGIMSALGTALNDLGGWLIAWVTQIFCLIVTAIIEGIAHAVGGVEGVISEVVNDIIGAWNDCPVCPVHITPLVLGWSKDILDLVPMQCREAGANAVGGYAHTHKAFRVQAYDRFARLTMLEFDRRYKICVEDSTVKYGFDPDPANSRSCSDIQRCVNTPAEHWQGLDGDAPDYVGLNVPPVTYKEIHDGDDVLFLPKEFYDKSHLGSVAPPSATRLKIYTINGFFGALGDFVKCNDKDWCSAPWDSAESPRKKSINVRSMLLMDLHCHIEPVTSFDSGRVATGCFRYIQDAVLEDKVPGLVGKLHVWHQPHSKNVPFLTQCASRCSMFSGTELSGAPTPEDSIFDGTVAVQPEEYYVATTRLTLSSFQPEPVTDFCFCIPSALVDKFWVEPADRCTIAYHTTSGRDGRGLFSAGVLEANTYEGSESCLNGYSQGDLSSLGRVSDKMPIALRERDGELVTLTPACGMSYNDAGNPSDGGGNLNKDNYLSIYKPRNMVRQVYSGPHSGGARRLLASEEYIHVPEEPFNATEAALNYDWNGASRCDQIAKLYKVYDVANHSANWLQTVEYGECLQLRLYGESLAHSLMIDDFPRDVFYFWQRKWMLFLDFFYGGFITVNWALGHSNNASNATNASAYNYTGHIYDSLMHPRMFLSFVSLLSGKMIDTSKYEASVLDSADLFNQSTFNVSGTAVHAADSLRQDAVSVAVRLVSELSKHNINYEYETMKNGMSVLHNNIISYTGTVPSASEIEDAAAAAASRVLTRPHNKVHWKLGLMTYVPNEGDEYSCDEFTFGCTECALVDNSVEDTYLSAFELAHYYQNVIPDILNDFQSRFDAITEPFEQTPVSLQAKHHVHRIREKRRKRLGEKWILQQQQDAGNSSIDHEMDSIEEFAEALKCFFQTTNDDAVPFFKHGLSFWIAYPFENGCDMNNVIYNEPSNADTPADVLEALGISILVYVAARVIFNALNKPPVSIQMWLPLPGFLWELLLFLLPFFVYLYVKYEYQPLCLPYLPQGLLDDVSYTLDDTLDRLTCLCRYIPGLAAECPNDCNEFDVIRYNDCSDLLGSEGYSELWLFWAPTVYLHLILPKVLPFLTGIWPFSVALTLFPSLTNVMRLNYNTLSDAEGECLLVSITDVVGAGILGALGVYVGLQLFTVLNVSGILTTLISMAWATVQLVVNALIIVRTTHVPPHIQLALLSILVALASLLWNLFV